MKKLNVNQMEKIIGGSSPNSAQAKTAGAMLGAGAAMCASVGLLPLGIVTIASGFLMLAIS